MIWYVDLKKFRVKLNIKYSLFIFKQYFDAEIEGKQISHKFPFSNIVVTYDFLSIIHFNLLLLKNPIKLLAKTKKSESIWTKTYKYVQIPTVLVRDIIKVSSVKDILSLEIGPVYLNGAVVVNIQFLLLPPLWSQIWLTISYRLWAMVLF